MIDTEIDWAINIRQVFYGLYSFLERHKDAVWMFFLISMVVLAVNIFVVGLFWLFNNAYEIFLGIAVGLGMTIMGYAIYCLLDNSLDLEGWD